MPSTCPTARTKRTVQRPETRTAIPKTTWPNFRDHHKSVDRALLDLLCNLQRGHGWSYVAEAGLRKMICEDTGHMPGMDTVRRALDRLAMLGLLHQVWLVKGGVLPDGDVANAGVRLLRVAMSRAERHSFIARARRKDGREKTTGRVNHRALFELMTSQPAAKPLPPKSNWHELRRIAQDKQHRLLAEWTAQGLDPNTGKPPS